MTLNLSAPLVDAEGPTVDRWAPLASRATVGTALVDATPPIGIRAHNWGAARTEVAEGVHQPLRSSIVSIKDGDRWREIVTLDLCVWWGGNETYDRVVPEILERAGTDADHLLVHLVHTHAGPSLNAEGSELEGAHLVGPYRQRLIDAVVNGIEQARASAQDSIITWAYGSCTMAVNRDLGCATRDVVGFNPHGPADSTVLVGRISRASDGVTRAAIVNYACHPTTLAFENTLLSPDYIGQTRRTVEDALGVPCVFLQGASGDLAPRDQYLPGTAMTERNGAALGHAVLSTIATMGVPGTELRLAGVVESGAPLAIWEECEREIDQVHTYARLTVRLGLQSAMTSDALAQQWAEIDPVAAAERMARARAQSAGYEVDGVALHDTAVWSIGDAVLVAHPGEAYSLLQTELRRRHPDRAVLVLNLTNGPVSMYMPTRDAYAHDRYQVWQTRLEPGSLEKLIDVVDERIAIDAVGATGVAAR